jgi:hypothetical protein
MQQHTASSPAALRTALVMVSATAGLANARMDIPATTVQPRPSLAPTIAQARDCANKEIVFVSRAGLVGTVPQSPPKHLQPQSPRPRPQRRQPSPFPFPRKSQLPKKPLNRQRLPRQKKRRKNLQENLRKNLQENLRKNLQNLRKNLQKSLQKRKLRQRKPHQSNLRKPVCFLAPQHLVTLQSRLRRKRQTRSHSNLCTRLRRTTKDFTSQICAIPPVVPTASALPPLLWNPSVSVNTVGPGLTALYLRHRRQTLHPAHEQGQALLTRAYKITLVSLAAKTLSYTLFVYPLIKDSVT